MHACTCERFEADRGRVGEVPRHTIVRNKGKLSDREIRTIRRFIKVNYHEMYLTRSAMSDRGFYGK